MGLVATLLISIKSINSMVLIVQDVLPDPDGSRTIAEFCENGAKAIADEGPRKGRTRNSGQWSVRELSLKSDKWLNSQGRLTHPLVLKDGSEYYEPISGRCL